MINKAEEELQFVEELKRKWVATIDALIDPLMIVGEDYAISKANMALAKLLGEEKDVKAVIGQKCYTAFGRKKPCKGCKMKSSAEVKEPQTSSLVTDDNSFYEVISQPIYTEQGDLDGVVQVYRDRTEAKRLEEQLLQSEKLASIGLLAGGIAHEINNPLGGILIFSQMILREMPESNPHFTDVKEIEQAAIRSKDIVARLLDFARQQPSSGQRDKPEKVQVYEALKTALRFAQVTDNAKKVEVKEDWHDMNLEVMSNRNKLIQLFLNLLQNAYQAMPGGGTLSLSSRQAERDGLPYVEYAISDTGIGISEEHIKKIFDPFFTTKDPGEGTGLGLAICYGILQELGGNLEVSSKLNKGTTFSVILPE